jgi:hypothetical protein
MEGFCKNPFEGACSNEWVQDVLLLLTATLPEIFSVECRPVAQQAGQLREAFWKHLQEAR